MKIVFAGLLASALCVTAAQAAESEKKAEEKPICKAEVETGSLVKKKKRCFTRAQWERLSESGRKTTQHLQDMSRGGPLSSN